VEVGRADDPLDAGRTVTAGRIAESAQRVGGLQDGEQFVHRRRLDGHVGTGTDLDRDVVRVGEAEPGIIEPDQSWVRSLGYRHEPPFVAAE
jgi:hypothetical protein